MTKNQIDAVLESVRLWPSEDREELAEVAREIEARRAGIHVMDEDERTAIAEAREGELVPEKQVDAFWKHHGIE